MRTHLHAVLATVVSGTLWLSAEPAGATVEIEPNESIGSATVVAAPDVGEGTRSSTSDVDTFVFTGLIPGIAYEAFADAPFLGLAWLADNGLVRESVAFQGQGLLLEVVPNESGEVAMQICGHSPTTFEYDCSAASSGLGSYAISLPAPGAGLSAVAALGLLAGLREAIRRRR